MNCRKKSNHTAKPMNLSQNHRTRGYILGALAAATYGTNPLFALPLYDAGMNVDSVLLYRYLIAAAMMALLMLTRMESLAVTRHQLPALVIAGVLFALSSWLLFESYNYMDVGIASTILFVYPVIVAIIMAVCYHERLNPLTSLSIILALVGIVLLYDGGGEETVSTYGIILVVLASIAYAVYMVAINKSRLRHMSSMKLTFYSLLFGSSVFIVRVAFVTDLSPVTTPLSWWCIIAIGIFPTIISLMAMAVAIRDIGSTPTAILGALEPVTALIIGVLIFGESLTPRSIFGIFLVLAAVTLLVVARPLFMAIRQLLHLHR